jgi:SAM-dependent methyltransferase
MSVSRASRGRSAILETVARYYSEKLDQFGPTARGVDWNSSQSQRLRFAQLLQIDSNGQDRSLIDYGCGYGALADYLLESGRLWRYTGFDVSEAMIGQARTLHAGREGVSFTTSAAELAPSDYTVASGIFNVRLRHERDIWHEYVLQILDDIDRLALSGFAFNMLSTYSDPELRRADLYYADPAFFFDYCKRRFSPHVTLLHDYPLYEFTIIVRKKSLWPS